MRMAMPAGPRRLDLEQRAMAMEESPAGARRCEHLAGSADDITVPVECIKALLSAASNETRSSSTLICRLTMITRS